MTSSLFFPLQELQVDMEGMITAKWDEIEEQAEELAVSTLSSIFTAIRFERILTRRVFHEYYNLIELLKVRKEEGGETLKNLETRIQVILKNRIRIISLVFTIMLFLSRDKLNLTGGEHAGRYIQDFIDEITDINRLISDEVTAKFFESTEREIILSMVRMFLFFYEKTVQHGTGEGRSIRYDREKIMTIVTTLELFLDPIDPLLNAYDFIFSRSYRVAIKLVERMLENPDIGDDERFRLTEYLLKKLKVISYVHELRLLFERSNYFLKEGQFIRSLEEIRRFWVVNKKIEETLSGYAGPKITFLQSIRYQEMVEDTRENEDKLKLLEFSYSLHEGILMGDDVSADLSMLIQHMKTMQGKQVLHPFAPSAFLTSIIPILVQPGGIEDNLKVRVLESMFGSFVDLSINHVVNIGKELVQIYKMNEFALSPQDVVKYSVKVKEIDVFLHSLFAVPSFVDKKEVSTVIAELTKSLVSTILYLTTSQPNFTLTSDFYDLLNKMYVYGGIGKSLELFTENSGKFFNHPAIAEYAAELVSVSNEIKDFILTVSANVELSLHWNILEYLYITIGVRQLNLALTADEEQAITLGEGNELMRQFDQVGGLVDDFLGPEFLSQISKRFRNTFENSWRKHQYYLRIQRNIYVMLFNLFKGFSLTQRSGVGNVLIAKVSKMIEDLKVPAEIMAERKFEGLASLLTKIADICNVILADGYNYQLSGTMRELVTEYTKCVINPVT